MRLCLWNLGKMIALFACWPLLAGCWSSVELNDRLFTTMMIVDADEEGIRLTLGFPLPNKLIPGQPSGSDVASPSLFYSRTGPGLEEALQRIQGDLPRRVTFGHNRLILFGSEYAKQGITDVLEFAVRNPFFRLDSNLFMIEGEARKLVADSEVFAERFFVTTINGLVRNNQVMSTTVRDLLLSHATGGDGLLPILDVNDDYATMASHDISTVGTGGAGILRNGKLEAVILSAEETAVARSMRSQLPHFTYTIKSPSDERSVGFFTTALTTKIKPHKTEDGVKIVMTTMLESGVIASNSDIDLVDQKSIEALQEEIIIFSNKQMRKTIDKIQQSGADVFHFDLYISTRYPDIWEKIREDWPAYYKEKLPIEVETQVEIKRIGSSIRSLESELPRGK